MMSQHVSSNHFNMTLLAERSAAQLAAMEEPLRRDLALQRANQLSLDLTRGKPAPDQLDLSAELDAPLRSYIASDGTDARNYGALRGLPEARALGAELLEVEPSRVFAVGNSSLFLMFQVMETAMRRGLWGDERRWNRVAPVRVLVPAPGYDRHFTICESLGIEMLTLPMLDSGPDMDAALALAAADANIKGIWCVPKYANPTGCIYAETTVRALASLPQRAAADDFVVFWDNAYAVHDFEFPRAPLANLYDLAVRAGTEDHVALFASTSKITYASGGLGFCAGSDKLLAALERTLGVMMIGSDKVSQLRHVRLLAGRVEEHMARQAALLKPKFDLVDDVLQRELGGLGIATWTQPKGGYFVSLDVLPGTATRVVALAREAGLKLTPAGATFPYGRDPDDTNIRIAPTFTMGDDLATAMQVFTQCVKLACIEKLRGDD